MRGVYLRTVTQLRCLVRHLAVPDDAVDPVIHEAYTEVVRRGESLQNMGATRSLLARVARRLAARERSKPGVPPGRGIPPLPARPETRQALEAAELVERFLDAFDLESRDIFVLGTFGVVPPDRIASELGLSRRQVKRDLKDMRQQFAAVVSASIFPGAKEALQACVAAEDLPPEALDANFQALVLEVDAAGPKSRTDMPVPGQVVAGAEMSIAGAVEAVAAMPYAPERVLGRRTISPAMIATGSTFLVALVIVVFALRGRFAGSSPPPAEAESETTAELEKAVEEVEEEQDGTTGTTGEDTAAAAEDTGGAAEPAEAAPAKKKAKKSTSGGKKRKTVRDDDDGGSDKPSRKKTKREKRAEVAEERDPGRVIYELEMLKAGKNYLSSNAHQALAYANQHEKEFPRSQFVEQRREIQIKALCKLGRVDQARALGNKSAKSRGVFSAACGA
ncbi:MAG: hypothetical protein KC636_00145 [Myxococcales bacterium]|nr:hypothetical protein [Myxococcales bacterium]